MKKEDKKMYLNFKRIIAVILFVISLSILSACEENHWDKVRMIDENEIWYCEYLDETIHKECAVGELIDDSKKENYVFFPESINNIPVVQIGYQTHGMAELGRIDYNRERMFIPYTVKRIYDGIRGCDINCHIITKNIENIKRGATVPNEYYEYYVSKFQGATFRKANVVYYLNYEGAKCKYYCIDHEFYSIGKSMAKWVNDNGNFSFAGGINVNCIIQGVRYNTQFRKTDWKKNEENYLEYDSKIKIIPPDPIREGYTFDGWYKEAECVNKWNFENDTLPEIKIDEDEKVIFQETALYAKWILN